MKKPYGSQKTILCLVTVLLTVFCACTAGKTEDGKAARPEHGSTAPGSSGACIEETSETEQTRRDDPDERYESVCSEEAEAVCPETMNDLEDWYGDYQFVGYVRPHQNYTPCPDHEQLEYRIRLEKEEIVSLTPESVYRYSGVDRKYQAEIFADYKYEHLIQESRPVLTASVLTEEVLEEMNRRWGKEFDADGGSVDFADWSAGDEEYFADTDFKLRDYTGCPLLTFRYPEHPSTVKNQEFWIYAGDGVTYSLTDAMVSEWRRLR